MIHVSSTDVFGRCSLVHAADEDSPAGDGPLVPYVVTKREAERVVTQEVDQGLQAVIVNPSFMLGPWDWKPSSGRMLLAVARHGAASAAPGWFSLCDAHDVAAGILAALACGTPGRRYLLAGRTFTWLEALRLMAEVTGARSPLLGAGPLTSKIGGWGGDVLGKISRHEPEINSAAVALAAIEKNYTSARAEAELCYTIRPSRDTIRDAWAWFQSTVTDEAP